MSATFRKIFIERLPPAYFAMVMATGIVAVACHVTGWELFAGPLLYLNVGLYAFLWILTVVRVFTSPGNMLADLKDLTRGPGYFTIVAATCVLGTELIVLRQAYGPGLALLALGGTLWLIIIYAVFMSFTALDRDMSLDKNITGIWLVAVVSTQSVAILTALMSETFASAQLTALFTAVGFFLVGLFLYMIIITLISYRLFFFAVDPATLSPSYWINMGAVAISTLAGATILESAPEVELFQTLRPFLVGCVLFSWSVATWWIPLLVLMGVWKHLLRRVPLRYTPEYWGLVFPLGMYTVCTFHLKNIIGFDLPERIADGFVYFALIAWSMTFYGFVRSILGSLVDDEE